jgi:hypothetical protein
MPDQPSHEDIDKYLREIPKGIIAKLPNNLERREAERLVDIMADLAHDSHERRADR